MTARIEDYAMIGDLRSAALVSRAGSIDWLCLPRFDSGSCFAALLGTPENGRWLIAPAEEAKVTRRYRPSTLILETTFKTKTGEVRLVDFMPVADDHCAIVRVVMGVRLGGIAGDRGIRRRPAVDLPSRWRSGRICCIPRGRG